MDLEIPNRTGCTKYKPRVISPCFFLFIRPTVNIRAYQFSPPAKHVHNMQSQLFTVYNCLVFTMVTCRFFGAEFLANGRINKETGGHEIAKIPGGF